MGCVFVFLQKKSADAYNRQFNRGIGFSPDEAVKLPRTEQEQVKANVKKAYAEKKDVGVDLTEMTGHSKSVTTRTFGSS